MQEFVNTSAKMSTTHRLMHRHYGGSMGTVVPGPAVPQKQKFLMVPSIASMAGAIWARLDGYLVRGASAPLAVCQV